MALVDEGGAAVPSSRSDEELVRLHVSYAVTRDKRLRHELAAEYAGFAAILAAEWGHGDSGTDAARAALMRAIDRYDDARHGKFRDYAAGRIRGELRRLVQQERTKVPERLHEAYAQVVRTLEDLTQEFGRSPTVGELAARSGLTEEQVLTAMELVGSERD